MAALSLSKSDKLFVPTPRARNSSDSDLHRTARGMQLKVADLSVFAHQYPRAAENYEMAGKTSMAGASGAYNAIDNFFKAGLCALITNMVSPTPPSSLLPSSLHPPKQNN